LTNPLLEIRIGTMVKAGQPDPAAYVRAIIPLGFESIQPFFWQTLGGKDIRRLASELIEAIGDADGKISALAMFGNPLEDQDLDRQTFESWKILIDNAGYSKRTSSPASPAASAAISSPTVCRVSRSCGASLLAAPPTRACASPSRTALWTAIGRRANGTSHTTPNAWEIMFNELPRANLGLELEPCHQLVYLIDPIPQIRKWAARIFHVHGKDATVRSNVIREHGLFGKLPFVQICTPGFGDGDWTRIISELRLAGFARSIDIEGWHDPVVCDALEMTGQVRALTFLKGCRGGASYVPGAV
jgi:sugar phosphate isomerase/epimerase